MWTTDIIAQLHADGVGTFGTDIFESRMADIPKLASGATIHVIDTGGSGADYIQNSKDPARYNVSAQLTIRANTVAIAEAKAAEAFASLVGIRNQSVNGTFYEFIKPLQTPFDGGVDDNEQFRIWFNIIGRKA